MYHSKCHSITSFISRPQTSIMNHSKHWKYYPLKTKQNRNNNTIPIVQLFYIENKKKMVRVQIELHIKRMTVYCRYVFLFLSVFRRWLMGSVWINILLYPIWVLEKIRGLFLLPISSENCVFLGWGALMNAFWECNKTDSSKAV